MGGCPLIPHDTVARPGRVRLAAAASVFGLLVGCAAPPTRYAWGSYEDQIYVAYSKPGALTPEMQADQLQKDREAARAANQKLPPGWHAHFAHVYYQMGRADLALEELAAEKTAFPEATTFVDRLSSNIAGRSPPATPAAVPIK